MVYLKSLAIHVFTELFKCNYYYLLITLIKKTDALPLKENIKHVYNLLICLFCLIKIKLLWRFRCSRGCVSMWSSASDQPTLTCTCSLAWRTGVSLSLSLFLWSPLTIPSSSFQTHIVCVKCLISCSFGLSTALMTWTGRWRTSAAAPVWHASSKHCCQSWNMEWSHTANTWPNTSPSSMSLPKWEKRR